MNPKYLNLDIARRYLRSGDLVFYRMTKKFGLGWITERLISWWQNSPYIHVGLIVVKDNEPWVIDMSASAGGRELPLVDDLPNYSVDIYRVNRKTNTRLFFDDFLQEETFTWEVDRIIESVKRLTKRPYSWRANLRIVFERMMGYDRLSNDKASVRKANCATVIESAFYENGFDLCPRVSPNFATPDRLAKSALVDYLFTVSQ